MKEVFCSEVAGILSKSDLELPTVGGVTNSAATIVPKMVMPQISV